MEKKYSWQIINGFWLKIIGFILMTIDHVGVFLEAYQGPSELANIFRIIGRIAFPIFIFLIVEGVRHTKNYGKYALRLGIVAAVMMITQIIIYYCFDTSIQKAYSPLLDLLACSCVIYLLKRKDKFSWLVFLPLGYIFLTFGVTIFESLNNSTVYWLPFYLRCGYSIYGLLLSLGFYYSYYLSKLFLSSSESTKAFVDTKIERSVTNLLCAFSIFVAWVIISIIKSTNPLLDIFGANITSYAIIAGALLILYSGERGYNKNWFKYGSYLYYPVHLIIIFIIFYLIY